MEKVITVDGKEIKLRASAFLPRLYRVKFNRDFLKDMSALQKAYYKVLRETGKKEEELTEEERKELGFSVMDLHLFENIAYIMAKHGDPENVDTDIEKWFGQFETFSIYENLGEFIDILQVNTARQVTPKKK